MGVASSLRAGRRAAVGRTMVGQEGQGSTAVLQCGSGLAVAVGLQAWQRLPSRKHKHKPCVAPTPHQ